MSPCLLQQTGPIRSTRPISTSPRGLTQPDTYDNVSDMAFAPRGHATIVLALILSALMLVGCSASPQPSTTPPSDTTPPVITAASVDPSGNDTAWLTLATNEPTLCLVEYGTTQAFGLSANSTAPSASHRVELSLLAPGQTYYVRACVQDAAGNVTTSSIMTFDTPKPVVDSTPASGKLAVYFIDVGQGDSILIDYGTDELLIDGGENSDCLSCLSEHVDGPIEVMVTTHMHADHIGGLPNVLERFDVESIWLNGETVTSNIYKTFMADVASEGADVHIARRDDAIALGDLSFDVLHPTNTLTGNPNLNSVVLSLTFGDVDFLFTGDAETHVEEDLVNLGLVHDIDILKVGHHCSSTSSCASFLDCIKPEVAIYGAAVGNSYGHPHADSLNRLTQCGAQVYGTDVNGTIVVTTDGQTYDVTTEHVGSVLRIDSDDDEEPSLPAGGDSDVRISAINYDGKVARTESDEYVEIKNYGSTSVDLKGWKLKDISDGKPTFTFPSYTLNSGAVVRVYTNEIHANYGGFSFGSATAVWANSDPDTAGLYDLSGKLVSQTSY